MSGTGSASTAEVASLRGILGDGPSEQELSALLSRAGGSVATAVNLYYDPPAPSTKRPVSFLSQPSGGSKQRKLGPNPDPKLGASTSQSPKAKEPDPPPQIETLREAPTALNPDLGSV